MYTHVVVFLYFGAVTKCQNQMTFFSYSSSPLIIDINGGVHYPMTIPYNLFVLSIKISSKSMYRLTRIYHIFIFIFDSSSFYVRTSGMCLMSKFITGFFRSAIILTISSAFMKLFRTQFFRTSWNLSNVTPWSSISVISPRIAFILGVSPLKFFFPNQIAPPLFPRPKFFFLFPLQVFLVSLFVVAVVVGSEVDVLTVLFLFSLI